MSRLQAAVFQVLEGFTLSDDVRKILEAAYYSDDTFAQGRAAWLEEERAAFEAHWIEAGGMRLEDYDLDYRPDTNTYADDIEQGAWEAWQARAALSPTSSDAGKDDARDAARLEVPHGWEDAIAEARNAIDCDEPTAMDRSGYKEYANVVLDSVADKLSALSSLEVIGKGEKG